MISTKKQFHIAGGGEYPLSAFNQFKHFLVLSLLITFSFNAFSVDNSQQPNKEEFNKEAYLDLIPPILTSLRPAPNVFKNVLALSLTKPSVLLMAWFIFF
jgi:hypothetical protein